MPLDSIDQNTAKTMLSYPFVAGLLGALISRRFVPKEVNVLEAGLTVLSGAIMAQYFTPAVVHYLSAEDIAGAIAFGIGLFGLSLTAVIYYNLKNTQWSKIIERRLGNVPPGADDTNGGS